MAQLDREILKHLISDVNAIASYFDQIKVEYFEDEYAILVELVKIFYKKYRSCITEKYIIDEYNKTPSNKKREKISNALVIFQEILNLETQNPLAYLLDSIKIRYAESVTVDSLGKCCDLAGKKNFKKVWEEMKQSLYSINKTFASNSISEGNFVSDAPEIWNHYVEAENNPDTAAGVFTGFPTLDMNFNGVKPGELWVISGRPGTGKSTLLMIMAANMFKKGVNIVYFTLEISKNMIYRRLTSHLAKVPHRKIRDGKLSPQERTITKQVLAKIHKKYSNYFYIVDAPRGTSFDTMQAKIEELKSLFTPHIVIVDHLGLVKPSVTVPGEPDWLSTGRVAEEAHEFARTSSIPILSAVQTKRIDRSTKNYDVSSLSRSDMIGQNADVVLQIVYEEDYELLDTATLQLTKARDGALLAFNVCKRFDIMQIYEPVGESNSII